VDDVQKGQAHKTMIGLHRRHGNLFRIAANVVSVADTAMMPVNYNFSEDFTKVWDVALGFRLVLTTGPDRVLPAPKHHFAECATDEPLLHSK